MAENPNAGMRVLIVNTVCLNAGDALITQATVDLLREEFGRETTFVVHESQPGIAQRYYPDFDMRERAYRVVARPLSPRGRLERALQRARLARFRLACELIARGQKALGHSLLTPEERRLVADFVDADVVVTSGGTYLVEHYDFTSRLFALEVARRLRRRLVFFTQSLGPFTRPDRRRDVARAVDHAELVLLRDDRSLQHLRDLGVREDHLHVTADVVFAMADEDAVRVGRERGAFPEAGAAEQGPRVAISVREWSHFTGMTAEEGMAAYRHAMAGAVKFLVEEYRAHVTFVSTCQGIPEYWTDDSRTALEIVDLLPPHLRASVDVDRGFHHPGELAEMLRGFDLVVTTRMHMAILALGVGTLVFPIAYEFKTRELFDRLGLAEYVHDMDGVDADGLVASLRSFLDDAAHVRAVMFDGVARERERALASGRLVREALRGATVA